MDLVCLKFQMQVTRNHVSCRPGPFRMPWPIWQTHSYANPCALLGFFSRSGFCSTDRFHGNGLTRVFLFWSEAGKFKICNQISDKKTVNIVILHSETTRRS